MDYNGDGLFSALDDVNEKATITVDSTGRYVWTNANEETNLPAGATVQGAQAVNNIQAKAMAFQVTSYKDDANLISSNDALANLFRAWQGTLSTGTQTKSSSKHALSSFSTSLQMYRQISIYPPM